MTSPPPPRYDPGRRRAKRVADLAIAVPLVAVLTPVALAVAAAMGANMLCCPRDRGALIYRERRISRGQEFDLFKFRTLRNDALHRMRREGGHARLYEDRPENLTWAGRRILKPWYLDELPQLVNVLRGEMTFVGPRPWPAGMVDEQVRQGIDYRLRVVPGWTGPAQVTKGVQGPGFAALDQAYVERLSHDRPRQLVRYDLGVLRETLGTMRRGEGLSF